MHHDTPLDRRRFLSLAAAGTGLLGGLWARPASAARNLHPVVAHDPSAEAPELLMRSSRPLDLETPVSRFTTYLTPNDVFFVRSHHDAPTVDAASWRLTVNGMVAHPLTLSLAELRAMPSASVDAVLQCAGNGRAFYAPRVPGVPWERGAAGCARWTGVRLKDVLARAGLDHTAAHLVLAGVDAPVLPTTPKFTRSIPMAKALHPDTLLAYEMNGEPLPPLHGFPVRVVAPGWVGDDWVKWLGTITAQAHEYEGFFVQVGYRYPLEPGKPGEAVPPSRAVPMTELPVKSLIAAPAHEARLPRAAVLVQGVAWTGGDALVDRVDVSTDGGASWTPAEFLDDARPYAWRRWRLEWTPTASGRFALLSRATDSHGHVQPMGSSPWNPGGYLWNAADAVAVTVEA